MKYPVFAALFLAAAPALMAQTDTTPTVDSTIPTITIVTPAINSSSYVVLSGTATDTGTTASPGGIRAVYYRDDTSSKWKEAKLTAKGALTTTWIVSVRIKEAGGRRYYFRAVDRSGNESDVVGRRFRHGS